MNSPSPNGSLSPALIDQMPAMLWAIDGNLRFTSCRGGALADLGLAPDSLVGMTLFEFFQTEDTAFTPIAATLKALRGETVDYELDWGARVYRVRVGPNKDGAGQITGAVSVVFDISDVRREEAMMLSEGEFLRKIAENMPDAVVLVDGEGRFLYASPSCAEELGYDFQALAGVNFLSLIEPEDLAIAQDAIGDVYRGDSYPFAVRMRRADGSWALMETMATAVTTAEGIRLLLVSMRDVSEEKRSGEYVHLNRRMAEFKHKAQETAENLRQLLVTIERGDSVSTTETQLAQVLTNVEQPSYPAQALPNVAQPPQPPEIAG
ncbi:MAG TPA: PAS domain-containing protein [Gaiellaceae bacterium]